MSSNPTSRHPSARASGGDLSSPVSALLKQERATPCPHWGPHVEVAVATLAVRGREHRSRGEFAKAYGLSEAEVQQLETGWVDREAIPVVLAVLTPLVSVVDFGLSLGPAVVSLPRR